SFSFASFAACDYSVSTTTRKIKAKQLYEGYSLESMQDAIAFGLRKCEESNQWDDCKVLTHTKSDRFSFSRYSTANTIFQILIQGVKYNLVKRPLDEVNEER